MCDGIILRGKFSSCLFPVRGCLTINIWQACNEQLQLLIVEDGDEVTRNEVVEAGQECVDLRSDGGRHAVVRHCIHVRLLVLLSDSDVAAAWNELMVRYLMSK